MHVVDSLGNGGLENGLVNLIQGLSPSYFEHVVFTMRGKGPNASRLPQEGVQLASLNKIQTESRFQTAALVRAIRKFRPHVIHSRNWAAIEAVIAGRWVRQCALIHSEHGLEADANAPEPRRRIWFRRLAYELADRVVSVSRHLRDLHSGRTGFPVGKFEVIHNGVDTSRFFSDPAARVRVRRELGLSDGEFCIGCVGNLLPVKDHGTLFRAAAELSAQMGHWRLLLIGEGPERPKLEALLGSHPGLRRHVSILGSSDRISELLNGMDAYALPSVAEGISNALLEAMATGLPVVATAVGGNPEVVVNGESGLLFPVGDYRKLAELLRSLEASAGMREELSGGAKRRVNEEFSIASMVGKYGRLYESVAPMMTVPVGAPAGA